MRSRRWQHFAIDNRYRFLDHLFPIDLSRPRGAVMASDEPVDPIQRILVEFGRLVEPLAEVASDPDILLDLVEEMGIDETALDQDLSTLLERVESMAGALESLTDQAVEGVPDLDDVPNVFDDVNTVVAGIGSFSELSVSGDVDVEHLGDLLLDYLLVEYLDSYHPDAFRFLAIAGVIRSIEPAVVDFTRLNDLFDDPAAIPAQVFGQVYDPDALLGVLVTDYLNDIAWNHGLPAQLEGPDPDEVAALLGKQSLADVQEINIPAELAQQLVVPLVISYQGGIPLEVGVRVIPLPGIEGNDPGVAIVPFGTLEDGTKVDLGGGWLFTIDASGEMSIGVILRPDEVRRYPESGSAVDFQGEASIEFDPSRRDEGSGEADRELVLLGGGPNRLAITGVGADLSVDAQGDEFVVAIAAPLGGLIRLKPDDGFLSSVLPVDGVTHDFDVTVGWSSETGLFFERGGTLEVSLPQKQRIGPALLEEIYLSIGTPDADSAAQPNASPAAMHIVGAASASIELGPIVGTIKRMGVSADVSFPENADGNLGPIDLDMGFEPPDGIGLVVDAGGVTGGGYLEFDHENERYAGTLQLHIGDLVLSAVGLLTTRLPDGSSGFSLLVIIAGEFTPVQLGLGFTLNGVGGLLGINRSFRAEPLGEAVREGSLDSVLFPVDPVANAQRIISDLRAIFPPTRDVHVFGPMAKLGYGTPAMVTADLAVLLEIPTFKLAVLGRLRARLPDEEAPLVILNMDVVGVLDPPGQRASIDASLFDSRIGAYTVSGDMAMRTSWGENPRFVLSVGGFHPRFDPPADFPALRRVRVGIGEPGGNPSIDLNGYLALTSNTAQVGAGASFRAEAGPAKVEGKFAFDALFEFDPFRFVIDFLVHVSVRVYGKGLSVRVDGTLSGTSPWRVKGRISIDLWLIEVNASIDLTLGEKETHTPLPAARVMPLLAESISNPSNWAAQLPPRGRTSVTLREVKTIPDEVLVHPLGRLSVRQTVVPLEFQIETFRRATPGDFVRFSITGVTIEGTSGALELGESTTEQFAPAQFLNLTDDQKLDTPAFESLEAGRRMSTDGLGAAVSGGSQRALLTYETTVVDREEVVYGRRLRNLGAAGTMLVGQTWAMTEALAETSAVAKAQRQAIGPGRTAPVVDVTSGTERDEPTHRIDARTGALTGQIRLNEETYAIADARTMEPVDPVSMQPITVDTAERNTMPKSEAKRTLSRYEATHPGDAGLYRVVAMHRLRSAAARPA